jgi:hypothetical protein
MRVLLILDRPDDRFAGRIRAEVAGLGLAVLTVEPWRTGEPMAPLEEMARSHQAVAAIRVIPSRTGVEVWMADRTTGRSLLRQLVVDETPGGPNEGLVALQTAELLRTSLLSQEPPRADTAPPPAAPQPPSPPVLTESSPAAPPMVKAGLQAGLGALFAPGGTGTTLQLWLSLHRSVARRLSVAVDVSLPLQTSTVEGPEGSARIGATLGGAALLAHAGGPAEGLFGVAGLGVAVIRVDFDGHTSNPMLASQSSSLATGALYLRADGGFEATRWLRLGVRAVGGATAERAAVRFAGNQAGTWGPIFLAAFLVLDLSWH